MLPVRTIAERLRSLFPDAEILFTTRNQLDYVVSSYLNLKRNYALLAQRPIEPFDRWFEGNHTQVANLFLRNLDYSQAIRTYIDVFGRDSVFVIPLELLLHDGVREYLDRLGSFLKIDIRDDDIANYSAVWNRRMTTLEDAFVGATCEEPRFHELYDVFMANANGAEAMNASAPSPVGVPFGFADCDHPRARRDRQRVHCTGVRAATDNLRIPDDGLPATRENIDIGESFSLVAARGCPVDSTADPATSALRGSDSLGCGRVTSDRL
jgi:hypothetical protein